jgi:hypothetical protein
MGKKIFMIFMKRVFMGGGILGFGFIVGVCYSLIG